MTGGLHKRVIEPTTARPEQGCAGAAVTADGETVAPANLPINVGQRRKSLAGGMRSMRNGGGSTSTEGGPATATCAAWKTRARHPASGRHGRGQARSRPVPAERKRYLSRLSHTSPAGKAKGAKTLRPCGGLHKEIVISIDKKNQPNMAAQNNQAREEQKTQGKEQPMNARQQPQQARQQQEPGKGEKREMAGERNERGRPDDEMQKQQEEQRKLEERAKKPKDGMEAQEGQERRNGKN